MARDISKGMVPMVIEKFPDALGFVANGGSLIDYCQEHKMEYNLVITWIYDNRFPERSKSYEVAILARNEYVVQAVLRELKSIATIDIREAFNQDGTLRTLDEMPPEITRVISSIEVKEEFECDGDEKKWTGYTKKVKLTDKLRALELLGKNLLLFVERKVVSGKVEHVHRVEDIDLEDRIKQIKERRGKAIDVTPASTIVKAPEDF